MQVTHVQDHVTHAVVGQNAVIDFGISDDPEFFNILSSTLYSDQILAVVRETLCNAWDAHIEAGCTDVPIHIELTNEHLIIRDRGPGIHKQLMGPLYGTYGGSSKKNDGRQTGGFGLGCKAPFAYQEHFEVISHHMGEKTIYRISKSSAEVGGKPGILPIVTVPTTETGVQVKIDIKTPMDVIKFREKIAQVVMAGEMNANLNGNKLMTLPFSQSEHGFLIVKERFGSHSQPIFIRYGNVVYPVERHETLSPQYSEIHTLLNSLEGGYGQTGLWRLVLQAAPNTISVTPSRESLNMTERTLETIKQLFVKFQDLVDQHIEKAQLKHLENQIEKSYLSLSPARLLTHTHGLPFSVGRDLVISPLTNFDQIAGALLAQSYPRIAGFRRRDITLRVKALIEGGFGNKGMLQSFLAEYLKEQNAKGKYESNWFHRRLVAPLVTDLKADPQLSPNRLMVRGSNQKERRLRVRYTTEEPLHEATQFGKDKLEDYLPFLRNFVILSFNRIDVTERAPTYPIMRRWLGQVNECLVYVVQRSDARVEAARAFFKARGFTVVDLTQRMPWEHDLFERKAARKRETPVVPRKKGLPVLSSIWVDEYRVSTDRARKETALRTEDPKFIVRITDRNDKPYFQGLDAANSAALVHLFGDQGGITVTEAQDTKYRAQGAISMLPYVAPKVFDEIKTNPRIHAFFAVDASRLPGLSGDRISILDAVLKDRVLSTYFDVDHNLTSDDRMYILLWRKFQNLCKHSHSKEVAEVFELIKGIKTAPKLKSLYAKIRDSKLIGALDYLYVHDLLQQSGSTDLNIQQAKIRDMLIFAIKG